MNIGIVTTWFERGAAYVSRAYMSALTPQHSVYIYARAGEQYAIGDPRWDQPNVTWAKPVRGKPYMYIDWREFLAWLRRNAIDVVIFNEQQDWDIILRCRQLEIPIGAYVDYYTTESFRFYWLYDFLLCNTRRHFDVFSKHPQAYYIPWGTDLRIFQPGPQLAPHEKTVFFHSCGVSPDRKGTQLLVAAFSRIRGRCKLVIHSQWPLAKDFPELVGLIRKDSRIVLIEQIVPAPGLYHLGDVYVYPTVLEGIGLTIAEALACGLPVITTNEPPMNEFVVDGENGKLVQVATHKRRGDDYYWEESYCDEDSLVKAMQYYVDHVDLLPEFRKRARTYAIKRLDWYVNAAAVAGYLGNVKIIHSNPDQELVRKVRAYEGERLRQSAASARTGASLIARAKDLVRYSSFYPLIAPVWQLAKRVHRQRY